MGFFALLKNAGTIITVFKTLKEILTRTVESKNKIPTCDDTVLLVHQLRVLLEKKVIDIPNFDENDVIVALQQIESNIVCSVDNAHKNIAQYGTPKGRWLPEQVVEKKEQA